MPECHRFASRPYQDQLPASARGPGGSMKIEPLRATWLALL